MPYRRLPNTDKARVRAIKTALKRVEETKSESSPLIPFPLFQKGKMALDQFHRDLTRLNQAQKQQVDRSKELAKRLEKAKLYIIHYLRVFNMSVERGEHKEEEREFFGLPKNLKSIPPLTNDTKTIELGKRLIDGDIERQRAGGVPIYSPSMALVKANYEAYIEARRSQNLLKETTNRNREIVDNRRREIDNIIIEFWDIIEKGSTAPNGVLDREKAKKYGVVYFFRAAEKKTIESLNNNIQRNFPPP